MTPQEQAVEDIRHARWYVERALPIVQDTSGIAGNLEQVRQYLGELAGDYREGEEARFASEAHTDG